MAKNKYKSDINLFDAIFKDKTRKAANLEKQLKDTLKVFACVAVTAAVAIIALNGTTAARITFIEKETQALATPEKLAEIEENKQLAASLKTENQMLQAELNSINASTKLTIKDIENIASYQPNSIVITSFSYTNAKITLSCTSTDELGGANFANALRTSAKFESIEYAGVSKSGNTYTFTIEITLKNETAEGGKNNE